MEPAAKSPLTDISVLIVDGHAPSARLVEHILVDEGCSVRTVPSGEAALLLLETFQPRLIVLDLILPGMSGLVFTAKLKQNPAWRHTVVFAVSAFDGEETKRLALDAGCAGYVQKPIDPFRLPQQLRESLEAAGKGALN